MSQPSLSVSQTGSQAVEKKADYISYEAEPGFTVRLRQNFDPAMDPKKLRRLISNRVAAQRSKWRKIQYADGLLKKSQELEMKVSMLRSLVENATEQKKCLEIEQMKLEECHSAWLQHCIDIEGEMEANQLEIKRLQNMIFLSDISDFLFDNPMA